MPGIPYINASTRTDGSECCGCVGDPCKGCGGCEHCSLTTPDEIQLVASGFLKNPRGCYRLSTSFGANYWNPDDYPDPNGVHLLLNQADPANPLARSSWHPGGYDIFLSCLWLKTIPYTAQQYDFRTGTGQPYGCSSVISTTQTEIWFRVGLSMRADGARVLWYDIVHPFTGGGITRQSSPYVFPTTDPPDCCDQF